MRQDLVSVGATNDGYRRLIFKRTCSTQWVTSTYLRKSKVLPFKSQNKSLTHTYHALANNLPGEAQLLPRATHPIPRSHNHHIHSHPVSPERERCTAKGTNKSARTSVPAIASIRPCSHTIRALRSRPTSTTPLGHRWLRAKTQQHHRLLTDTIVANPQDILPGLLRWRVQIRDRREHRHSPVQGYQWRRAIVCA